MTRLWIKIFSVAALTVVAGCSSSSPESPQAGGAKAGPGGVAQDQQHGENGQVSLTLPDGSIYQGPLRDGMLSGQGTLEWPTGDRYQGDFLEGRMHGMGEYHYRDGTVYIGEFSQGVANGQGRYESPYGDVFEGEFVNDQFHGHGRHTTSSGETYEGVFRDWGLVGEGTYTDADGGVYTGIFDDGFLNGYGTYRSLSGEHYEGGFDYGGYEGYGQLTLENGDVYVGQFSWGEFNGMGVLTYAQPDEDGPAQLAGNWIDGFHEDEYENDSDGIQERAEQALYLQNELLQEELSNVPAGRVGEIELYALAMAGDGTQEVFRREIEFFETQFADRFTDPEHMVSLVNSRTTVETRPMATISSFKRALTHIAEQMNQDEDILFLFLTSHGSSEHEFIIQSQGIELPDLPAATLATAIRETGIRWKVIVISACYSGGYIDGLADEQTLIIASARKDRTSFGCADENDFAFFTKAYFHDALPQSEGFIDAFELALVRVTQMEQEEAVDELSEPQISVGDEIADYLTTWMDQREPVTNSERRN